MGRVGIVSVVGVAIVIEGVGGGTSENGGREFVISGEMALTGGGVGEGVGGSLR